MSDSYLQLAHYVLGERRRPMSAKEILEDAAHYGLMPSHLSGATMTKTLQARITEDILLKRKNSEFYRTKRGTYFLRSLSLDKTLAPRVTVEVHPPGRRRPLPRERILQFHRAALLEKMNGKSVLPYTALSEIETYYSRDQSVEWVPSCVFVCLRRMDGALLSHTIGAHSLFPELVGQISVGFRAYIDEFDRDLFLDERFGFPLSAQRELARHVEFSHDVHLSNVSERLSRSENVPWAFDIGASRIAAIALVDLTEGEEEYISLRRRLDVNRLGWTMRGHFSPARLDPLSFTVLEGGLA